MLACPFTQVADELGDSRACNMVMLGALLEIAGVLQNVNIDAALRRLVKSPRWMELNERALARGRELYKIWIRVGRCAMQADGDPNLIVYFGGQLCSARRGARGYSDACPALRIGRV